MLIFAYISDQKIYIYVIYLNDNVNIDQKKKN